MKELEKKETPDVAGGGVDTIVNPPGITYPIQPIIQPITPEPQPFELIVPEQPLLP